MSRTSYHAQLEGAISATLVHTPTVFSWFGKRSPRILRSVERELTPRTARNYLLYHIQSRLYSDFYCQGEATPTPRAAARAQRMSGVFSFVEQLADANSGRGFWQTGWELEHIVDDLHMARRGGLHLLAHPHECLTFDGEAPKLGASVSLHFSKESRSVSPGFYMAMSDTELAGGAGSQIIRFYWNLVPEGARFLMENITQRLNAECIPFVLKIINDPERFIRCDCAVLYARRQDYEQLAPLVSRAYEDVEAYMRRRVPALTLPLAPGLALAEDPGGADSFGIHRCRLLADGIIRAYEEGRYEPEDRLQSVVGRFAEEGISLRAPYLASGLLSLDEYVFPWRGREKLDNAQSMHEIKIANESKSEFLEAALDIGKQLVDCAIWYEGQCNWVGAEAVGDPEDTSIGRLVHRALGPTLYSGTAGVALFLGELYKASGVEALRRTALGAIFQALTHAGDISPKYRIGMFTGAMGIAVVAVRLGLLLDDQELVGAGRRVASQAIEITSEQDYDLLAGQAGGIVGCLLLNSMLEDESLLGPAARLGDEIIGAAHKRGATYSWRQVNATGNNTTRNLTGYSHGAAGIGDSLLSLWAVTGESSFRDASVSAFEYEKACFDPVEGNWPDFREYRNRSSSSIGRKNAHSFATFWCHGAPGIGLSRIRAFELLGDKQYRDQALTALHTTHVAVQRGLSLENANFSLCHGLAGTSTVLLHGNDVIVHGQGDMQGLALLAAYTGIERYGKNRHPWPCGTGGEQIPGLMLGIAGIGHFYLRLHSPTVPSALFLKRAEWKSRP